MLSRRSFLNNTLKAGSGLVFPYLNFLTGCRSSLTKPNIVWIIGDDLGTELGCYGESLVHTPNCDKLASEGIRYTSFYTTSPVCSPSRSAFTTGMYQNSIHSEDHRTLDKKRLPSNTDTMMNYLRKAGYFTSCGYGVKKSELAKTDYNFLINNPFDGTDWSQRKPGQPFFAQIQIYQPHRAFVRDENNPIDPDKITLPPYYVDNPLIRKDWALYLESVQIFDKKVGDVLQRLKEEGLADNTIVILFGDNGRPHFRGKQFLYEPGLHVPLIIRYPGNINPGSVNTQLHSAVDLIPTCLNIVNEHIPGNLQGLPSILTNDVKRKYVFAARDRCGEAFDRMRSVRNKRYKYIRNYFPEVPYNQWSSYKHLEYPGLISMEKLYQEGKLNSDQAKYFSESKPVEELYDLEKDPHELNNLAQNSVFVTVLDEMRNALNDWIKKTGDNPNDAGNEEVLKKLRRDKREKYYNVTMKKRGLSPDSNHEAYLKWWEKQL